MKHLVLIAASLVAATPAFASKARLAAFQTSQAINLSPHIKDVQTAFDNPSDLLLVPDYATFEMGATNSATGSVDSRAEGGFAMTKGDAKWGFYVGRKSQFTTLFRTLLGFQAQENPVEIQYAKNADMKWGVSLNYSQGEQKSGTNPRKATAAGVRFGVNADNYDGYLIVGLGSQADGNAATNAALNVTSSDAVLTGGALSTNAGVALAQDNDSTYKGLVGFKFGGNYRAGDVNYFLDYYMDGAEYESNVNTTQKGMKVSQYQAVLGAMQSNKVDAGHWYYGVAARSFQFKREGMSASALKLQVDTLALPVFIGAEMNATSWMVLRGSVTQNFMVGERKIDTDTGTLAPGTNSIGNNTTAAAGVGLLFGKLTMDATLSGLTGTAATGLLDGTNLFAQSSLTYNF